MAEEKNEAKKLPIGEGKFIKPVELAGVSYTHFKLREATLDDLMDVEVELAQSGRGTHTPVAFNGEMMMRQMVKVYNETGNEFAGPFTMNLLKKFGLKNYSAIRAKQLEIDLLGEGR